MVLAYVWKLLVVALAPEIVQGTACAQTAPVSAMLATAERIALKSDSRNSIARWHAKATARAMGRATMAHARAMLAGKRTIVRSSYQPTATAQEIAQGMVHVQPTPRASAMLATSGMIAA